MPAFGTVVSFPVRGVTDLMVNSPNGWPSEYPPSVDTWWTGINPGWQAHMPTSVTRATAVITNPLCRMPWKIRDRDGGVTGPGDPGYPAWLTDPMLNGGSDGGPGRSLFDQLDTMTAFDLFSGWLRDALWLGLGLLAFQLNAEGQPRAGTVMLLSPTQLYRAEEGWALDVDGDMAPVDRAGMVTVNGARFRLLPLRHSLPGGVLGWHRAQVQLASRMTRYASSTFDSGIPSGVLSSDQPLTQSQADQARAEFHERQTTRQVAVLGNGTGYKPIAISPVDSELIEMGRLSNEAIAHAFELPAWWLDAGQNSMTYSNSGWYEKQAIDGPLSSWSARIEQTIGGLLAWGSRLFIDFAEYSATTTPAAPTTATTATTAPAPEGAPDESADSVPA